MRHPGAGAVLFILAWTTPLLSTQESSRPELRRGLWRFERSFEFVAVARRASRSSASGASIRRIGDC